MKKWPWLVKAFYVCLLTVLCLQTLMNVSIHTFHWRSIDILLPFILRYWGDSWLFLAMCIFCQAFMLLCPADNTRRQEVAPPSMRFVALEWFLLLFVLLLAFARWHLSSIFLLGYNWTLLAFGCIIANWSFWSWIFHRFHKHAMDNPIVSWIGSKINGGYVLRSVVSEIQSGFAKQEDNVPPKGMTSLALATGATLMGFVFGPGVCFLFKPTRHSCEL